MRRFLLVRDEDVSGVSGVGMVAEGVQFSNGKSVLNWTTQYKSTAVYDSIEELDAIHGHNGRTRIVWLNEAEEAEITAWRNDFHALREEFERQRDENAAMLEIVQAVVKAAPKALRGHTFDCWFCGEQPFQHFEPGGIIEAGWQHAPDCPVTKAVDLLKKRS